MVSQTLSARRLAGEEHRLPYRVRLERIDGGEHRLASRARWVMMHLDLSGGDFAEPTDIRLNRMFKRLTSGFDIRNREVEQFCLMITPLSWAEEEQLLGERLLGVPDDHPELRERSFMWLPVEDENERR
jgi:hypothetical protein